MTADGIKVRITDTQKKAGDLFVHLATVEQGTLKLGTALQLDVDHSRRGAIRSNHSATHLLHEALRQVLGDHIAQRGSMVSPDRLRFDFAHPKPISAEELARVEDIANDVVLENAEVTTRLMALDDAREAGARALFGEKYGDEVRVVSMGDAARDHGSNAMGWSVELCGGTHVKRTGDIGLISVTSESAVASGVRRIEALTGRGARRHANDTIALAKSAAAELRTTIEDVPARITALMEERKKLERELSDARKKLAMGGGSSANGGGAPAGIREVAGVKLMARAVEGVEMKDLKSLADEAKKQLGSGVVAIVGRSADGKAGAVVGVTADLTARFNAVELVRAASEALGGKGGGGRPDMAQAGGPDGAKADAALAAIEKAMNG
jgi:alanyl-tRNA synthetase